LTELVEKLDAKGYLSVIAYQPGASAADEDADEADDDL